jgi:thiamine biosynthesis lipoprotein
MGTTYQITADLPRIFPKVLVQYLIDRRLQDLTEEMSTYDRTSEISQFNDALAGTYSLSPDFYNVVRLSLDIYNASNGAWDPTMYPLISLWHDWIHSSNALFPTEYEINKRKYRVGFNQIEVLTNFKLNKKNDYVSLDLSAIAKGYGVDQLAYLLERLMSRHYLVEVGGEVRVMGANPYGNQWQIGIEYPHSKPYKRLHAKIQLSSGKAMASSGHYRNFKLKEGVRYSHIINPKTGFPVNHNTIGVTIVANSCAVADALATSLLVLSQEEGKSMLEKYPNASALYFLEDKFGNIQTEVTSGFPKLTLLEP